jgi:hypothetical protein
MSGQIPIYAVDRVQNPPFWHGRSQLGHGGRSSPAAVSRCAAGAGLEGPTEHQAIIQAARVQLAPTLPVKSSPGFYTVWTRALVRQVKIDVAHLRQQSHVTLTVCLTIVREAV